MKNLENLIYPLASERYKVALFGASIGHMFGGLKVRRESNRDKENKGRAIHDMVIGSIVLFNQEKYKEISELEDSPLL